MKLVTVPASISQRFEEIAMLTLRRRLSAPGARIPAIDRDAIERGLSEIHVPELPHVELPKIDVPDIDMPKIDLPRVELRSAVTDAASAVGLVRPRRSRWPLLLGGAILAALAAWVLMNSTSVGYGLQRTRQRAGRWIDEVRHDGERKEPVAFTAASTKRIEPALNAGAGMVDDIEAADPVGNAGKDYPEGLGRTSTPNVGA